MNNLVIHPRVAVGGIGGHIGILVLWVLTGYFGLEPSLEQIAAITSLCAFVAGWIIKVPNP